MIVLPTPFDFATTDVLPPEDLDDLYLYAQDAISDVMQKRFAKANLVLQFVEAVDTPYTQAMNAEELTFRFKCPFPCVVERGFLHANMTSAAEVTVNIVPAAGGTVTGCTTPYLTTNGAVASASVDTTDVNVDKFVLTKDTEYKITVSSGGNFTLNRFDVILQLATDRWSSSGSPSEPNFAPTLFRDSDAVDATLVAANNAALSTEALKFSSNNSAPTPMAFSRHGFTSGTSANLLKFTIPSFDSARAQARILRVYVFAYMAGVGGGTVTATLKNAAGTTIATASANVAGVTQASGDSGAIAGQLSAAGNGADLTSKDWSLTFANSSAGTNCIKASALVWLART